MFKIASLVVGTALIGTGAILDWPITATVLGGAVLLYFFAKK